MTSKRVLVLSLLAVACSDDGASGTRGDGALDRKTYTLCDGSDALRLSLVSAGGGPLPDSAAFTHPHGWQFLHVDGHCNFVASTNVIGQLSRGTFSREQGVTLSKALGLEGTAGLVYRFQGLCPDAPASVVMTPDAYIQSGCGDRNPPREVAAALAWEPAFALADAVGRPSTGSVSVLALRASDGFGGSTEWPFSFPIEEAAYDPTAGGARHEDIPQHAKTLTGADAVHARRVWADTLAAPNWRGGWSAVAGDKSYLIYFRDELEPTFAQKVAELAAMSSFDGARPIALCDPKRMLKSAPSSPSLTGSLLHAAVPANAPCGVELCWEGGFDEKHPVGAFVGLQKPAEARTCLGEPTLWVRADLTPMIDAFRAGYPGSPVEIDLGFGTLHDAAGDDAICRARSVESCAADARCRTIVGSLHAEDRRCTTPGVALGCMAKTLGCDTALTGGQAPDGRRALFTSGCIPEGWKPFYGEAPDYSLPTCDAATALCTSSAQCPDGRYCTTEEGDCRSPCPGSSEACPAVCAGTCRTR